jgi:uncharacterized protein YceK
MAFRIMCLGLLLSTLPTAGCGTVANLARQQPGQGGVAPFGGVRHDVWCIQKAANGDFGVRGHPKSDSEQYPRVALMALCAADLPLSLVGDVLTWPYTATYTYINQPSPLPPVMVLPFDGWPQTYSPGVLPEPTKMPPYSPAVLPEPGKLPAPPETAPEPKKLP